MKTYIINKQKNRITISEANSSSPANEEIQFDIWTDTDNRVWFELYTVVQAEDHASAFKKVEKKLFEKEKELKEKLKETETIR